MLKNKIKYLLLIVLILLCTKLSKADEYYDIPVGWEKLIEFDNAWSVSVIAEKNQILVTGGYYMYSSDNGKTFIPLNNIVKYYRGFNEGMFFYKGKLLGIDYVNDDGFYLYKYILQTGLYDSTRITFPINAYPDKFYVNEIDSTIIVKLVIRGGMHSCSSQVFFITRDGGDNWEYLPLYRNDRNCNFYEIIFDMKTPGKWIYKTSDSDDPTFASIEPDMTFITEDNGKTFKKKDLNIKLKPLDKYSNDDKYLSYDYENSVRGYYLYYYNSLNNQDIKGYKINDLVGNTNIKYENIETLVSDIFKQDTSIKKHFSIEHDYSTKYNQMLFLTAEYFLKNDKVTQLVDSNFRKIVLYNIESKIPQIILKRYIDLPDGQKYDDPTDLLFFDKQSGNVFVELCKNRNNNQRRIIIRKQLQDPSSIEAQNKQIETISIKNKKVTINNEFIEPKISIFDLMGKQINYKISSLIPLSFELPDNLTYGIYFLKIEDKLKIYNYKLIF